MTCPSCGASSFLNKCENCGKEFKDSTVCPVCGVRVGQKPCCCPYCNTLYYSLSCPTCGFTPKAPGSGSEMPSSFPVENNRKRHTALWVLGWIFMPYVAGTVLVSKSKRLPTWAKALISVGIWVLTLAVAFHE